MIAYKLCRLKANGEITPLFINKSKELEFNKWLPAECHPTKGYKTRPFWHCCSEPNAPHLSENGRVWVQLEIKDFEEFKRPNNQGGLWYLAKNIKIIKILKNEKN